MNITKRIQRFFQGLLKLGCALVLFLDPADGYILVIALLTISLLAAGIKQLYFYLTMARFMVGGIEIFYKGVVLLDLGLFVFTLDTLPMTCTMLYLIGTLLFAGGVGIYHALDAKRLQAGHWKTELVFGAGQMLMGIVCLFFLHSTRAICLAYSVGLLHSAANNFITAFRKTAIVYID